METVKAVEIGESIKFIESIKALFYFDPYSTTKFDEIAVLSGDFFALTSS